MIQPHDQENRWNNHPEHEYELPYANAAIDSFLTLAKNAKKQALAAEAACRSAISDNESSFSGVLLSPPQIREAISSGYISSIKSLLFCAESASQAQASVCEALHAAEAAATRQRAILSERREKVREEIVELETQTEDVRAAFALVSVDNETGDPYATAEAKKLLECLEAAYQKHGLFKTLQKGLMETEANVGYVSAKHERERQHQAELDALIESAAEEWRRACSQFKAEPESLTAELAISAHANGKKEEAPAEEEAPARRSLWPVVWSYVKIVLTALLLAFILRAYVFDVTSVDGTSMFPTLHSSDHLITSKISYLLGEPNRGDIVVLNAPDAPKEKYIKRIIGLPNESIRIKDGQVYINDELLDEPYLEGAQTNGDKYTLIPDGYYFVMGDNRGDSRDSRSDQVGTISIDNIHGKAVFRIFPLAAFGTL